MRHRDRKFLFQIAHCQKADQLLIFRDPEGDRDFGIAADVDLDETQELGEVVFREYRVGFAEDLLDL